MTTQNGALVLLKAGDGASPENFTIIGGMRVTGMTLHNQVLDTSNLESGNWQQLLSGAGIQKLTISGNGIFTDAASEEAVREYAFASSVNNYQLFFGNGDSLAASFLIIMYERNGIYDAEESYTLAMESAGLVTFTHV